MSEVKLGQLAPPDAGRDAIHVAVVPCVAGQHLGRGWTVSIDKEGKAWAASMDDYVGVVDPFKGDNDHTGYPVRAGERFWLLLKPGTVSNLRHSWAHPLFPNREEERPEAATPTALLISKAWLDAWCQSHGTDLEYLIANIQTGHVCFGITSWHGGMVYNDQTEEYELPEEFWQHYVTYTGKARPSGALTFRCAC